MFYYFIFHLTYSNLAKIVENFSAIYFFFFFFLLRYLRRLVGSFRKNDDNVCRLALDWNQIYCLTILKYNSELRLKRVL